MNATLSKVFVVRTHGITIDYIEASNVKAAMRIIRRKYSNPESLTVFEVVDGRMVERVTATVEAPRAP